MGVAEGRFYPLVAHPLLNHEDVYTRVDHACSPGVAAGMEHEILVILQAHPCLCPVPPRPKVPPGRHRPGGYQLGPQRSEEHTSELKSLMRSTYAVFCSKNKSATVSTTVTIAYLVI